MDDYVINMTDDLIATLNKIIEDSYSELGITRTKPE